MTRIAEIDPWTGGLREYAGGWSEFEAARSAARLERQYDAFEHVRGATPEVEALLHARRDQARAGGGFLAKMTAVPTGAGRTR